jgi:hypothetical protein
MFGHVITFLINGPAKVILQLVASGSFKSDAVRLEQGWHETMPPVFASHLEPVTHPGLG